MPIGGMLLGSEIKEAMRKGRIIISGCPNDEPRINPNSVNLTLNKFLKIYKVHRPIVSNIDYDCAAELCRGMDEYKRLTGEDPGVDLEKTVPNYLDMRKKNEVYNLAIPEDGLILYPGILYIGSTNEKTEVRGYVPTINGRSSTGRLGLSIHITAGFGDNGFNGTWTLEITVVEPLRVYYDEEVCQVSFSTVVGDIHNELNNYSGRYYNQEGPTESRMYLGNDYRKDN